MKKSLNCAIVVLITITFIVSALVTPLESHAASAPSIKVKYKMTGQTSLKITWSGPKKLKYWRIRYSIQGKNGNMTKYKTIKVLKRSNKTYTIRNLKKNALYDFEVTGGVKKKGKYKPTSMYDYKYNHFTGVSEVIWDDYAASDYKYSPKLIELKGSCYNNGLPIKSIEIYRKKAGDSKAKYKKIATVKKKNFLYKDKKVTPGTTYKYKLRAVGIKKCKKKNMYSPYSSVLTMSAVNQNGKYDCKYVEQDSKHLVIRLTSDKYNADLVFKGGHKYWAEGYGNEFGMKLEKWSTDGKTWKTASGKKTLSANKTIYLYFTYDEMDISDFTRVDLSTVTYNRWDCAALAISNESATAYLLSEYIH